MLSIRIVVECRGVFYRRETMEKETYTEKHKELMKKWKIKHNAQTNGFAEDGIVSPKTWFSLEPEKERIMFLLKETRLLKNYMET